MPRATRVSPITAAPVTAASPTAPPPSPASTAIPPQTTPAAAVCPLGLRSSGGPQARVASFRASTAARVAPVATSHAAAPRRQPSAVSASAITSTSGSTTA